MRSFCFDDTESPCVTIDGNGSVDLEIANGLGTWDDSCRPRDRNMVFCKDDCGLWVRPSVSDPVPFCSRSVLNTPASFLSTNPPNTFDPFGGFVYSVSRAGTFRIPGGSGGGNFALVEASNTIGAVGGADTWQIAYSTTQLFGGFGAISPSSAATNYTGALVDLVTDRSIKGFTH